jgi:hypothetical protein
MAKNAVAIIGDKVQEVETSIGNATESYKTNSGSKFCLHCTIHAPAISWDQNWWWTKLVSWVFGRLGGKVCVGFFELLSSCQVPNVFSLNSQWGPIKFPKFSICFPNMFLIAHHFVPYAFPNVVFLESIFVGKYIRTYMIKCLEWLLLLGGVSQKIELFYNEPIKETHCKKKFLSLEGIQATFSAQRCSKPSASKQFGKWSYLISSNHGLTILLELSTELVLLRVSWNKRFPTFSSPQTTFNGYMYNVHRPF